jgi:hypothetical protein
MELVYLSSKWFGRCHNRQFLQSLHTRQEQMELRLEPLQEWYGQQMKLELQEFDPALKPF